MLIHYLIYSTVSATDYFFAVLHQNKKSKKTINRQKFNSFSRLSSDSNDDWVNQRCFVFSVIDFIALKNSSCFLFRRKKRSLFFNWDQSISFSQDIKEEKKKHAFKYIYRKTNNWSFSWDHFLCRYGLHKQCIYSSAQCSKRTQTTNILLSMNFKTKHKKNYRNLCRSIHFYSIICMFCIS